MLVASERINGNKVVDINEESDNVEEKFGSTLVSLVGDAVKVRNSMRKFICFNELSRKLN